MGFLLPRISAAKSQEFTFQARDGEEWWPPLTVYSWSQAALTGALESAYREFEAGRLAHRGELARRHAVRHFDNLAAAVRVADIVEAAASGQPT